MRRANKWSYFSPMETQPHFRGDFKRNGTWYDAAVPDGSVSLRHNDEQHDQISSYYAYRSGDGLPTSVSACGSTYTTVKWKIFEDPNYGLDSGVYPPFNGYNPDHCMFQKSELQPYITAVARQMALDNAATLKAQGIEIYTIGLGNIDQNYLSQISSGPDFQYYTAGLGGTGRHFSKDCQYSENWCW